MSASYVQFPLFLLKDFFKNPFEAADQMITYGMYHYSERIELSPREVAYQILYDLSEYRLCRKIHSYLLTSGNQLIKDFDRYVGLQVPDEINDDHLMALELMMEADADFAEQAMEYAKVSKAQEVLGIIGKAERTLYAAKKVEALIKPREPEPMPMASTEHLLIYRHEKKTEFEVAQFLAYLAIRSILGVKQYMRTNKALILSRMFGYSKCLPPDQERTALQQKYATRYHMDRVLEHLQVKWGINIYSNHMRGFYVSVNSKMNLKQLAIQAEASKKKNQVAALKKRKVEALAAALQQLGNSPTPAQPPHYNNNTTANTTAP